MHMSSRHRTLGGHAGYSIIEMMMVLLIIGIVAAMVVPFGTAAMGGERISGQARAVAYQAALAKMRAAASFTRARLYVDRTARQYRLEVWDKTAAAWVTEGGTETLPRGVAFGFGAVTVPPANTQAAIAQPAACRAGLDAATAEIADTSCIVFNSRGIPIDANGAPTGDNALYVTDADGTVVYSATVSATGLSRLWWTATSTVAWQRQ